MQSPATRRCQPKPRKLPLSLYHLLDPEVLGQSHIRSISGFATHDPVHWDPYLHAWIVTRYEDVITVLQRFSADARRLRNISRRWALRRWGPSPR